MKNELFIRKFVPAVQIRRLWKGMVIFMENKTLLKANIKRHKGTLFGIFILIFLAAAAFGTVLTIWANSERYIRSELDRAGFGELTAWVTNLSDTTDLKSSIEALEEIERVEIQSLIYSNYTVNKMESDSEGQLITYIPAENRYRFFTDDLKEYREQPESILPGETYVSPSMVSMLGIKIGDEITFPIARAGKNLTLVVKGFYEDVMMGSSMIGMKGFLISESDRQTALALIQNAGIDALARDGAMLHIFPKERGDLSVSELNSLLNEQIALTEYTESVHSKDAIAGFMLILQNAFSGLMIAFALVLLFVVLIILSHSISSAIASDFVNIGILKTIGLTGGRLRLLQMIQYLIPTTLGLLCGFLFSVPIESVVAAAMITTTGVQIPKIPPVLLMITAFVFISLLITVFIFIRTNKVGRITPMKAIRGETDGAPKQINALAAFGNGIHLRLAFRQLSGGKGRYAGVFVVSFLLVFFASLVGRMDSWLGLDGEGMMDAFNPADHDIGVQSFGELTQEGFEKTILQYTDITDTYVLAMPTAALNGISYTANVIDEPERFHILEGRTCTAENEIVITEFIAANFGIGIGDTVMVRGDSGSGEYIVSGIYSCANDMGDNFGMNREGYLKIGQDHPNLWCWHYFLADSSQKGAIADVLENTYGGDVHVHQNTWPGLFGIISAMQALLLFMYSLVIVFILVVTVMTSSRILSVEQKDLGIYKAIGFSSASLQITFSVRFTIVSSLGGLVGIALAAVFTDPLVGNIMRLAGISSFSSSPGFFAAVLPLAIVTILFTGFSWLSAVKIRKVPFIILAAE